MKSLLAGAALIAVVGIVAATTPASAAFTGNSDRAAVKTGNLQLAQGATPEGWRKEGEPRFKPMKKQQAQTDSKGWEVTKFPPDQEPRFKKSKAKN